MKRNHPKLLFFLLLITGLTVWAIQETPKDTSMSARQQQLGQLIDDQAYAYDKADAITRALNGNKQDELQKALQTKLDAARIAKGYRHELCTKFHKQRVAGGFFAESTAPC